MNDALLEKLLYESEGATLDFKSAPYDLSTPKGEKEFVKDILAFVNAWRRVTAYILIGVKEVEHGRAEVVGISKHLSDHELQQKINGKTNLPVRFAYKKFTFEGKEVGVIEIPVQERPRYLKKDFQGLKAGAVYVRRGSTTAEASPEEIAQMGAADKGREHVAPELEIVLGDPTKREVLDESVIVRCLNLYPKLRHRVRDPYSPITISPYDEVGYYNNLIDYTYEINLLRPVGFRLKNLAEVAARDVKVSGRIIPRAHGVTVRTPGPAKPDKALGLLGVGLRGMIHRRDSLTVRDSEDGWELEIPFGDVHPGQEVWAPDPLWVGSVRDVTLNLGLMIFAQNLPAPQRIELEIHLETTSRPMKESDIQH